jgi:hypothetical protein
MLGCCWGLTKVMTNHWRLSSNQTVGLCNIAPALAQCGLWLGLVILASALLTRAAQWAASSSAFQKIVESNSQAFTTARLFALINNCPLGTPVP